MASSLFVGGLSSISSSSLLNTLINGGDEFCGKLTLQDVILECCVCGDWY